MSKITQLESEYNSLMRKLESAKVRHNMVEMNTHI